MKIYPLVTREVNLLPVYLAIIIGLIGIICVAIYVIVWIILSRRKKKKSKIEK